MWYGHKARHRQDACATRQVCWVWDMLGWGASQRSPKIVVEVSDSRAIS